MKIEWRQYFLNPVDPAHPVDPVNFVFYPQITQMSADVKDIFEFW